MLCHFASSTGQRPKAATIVRILKIPQAKKSVIRDKPCLAQLRASLSTLVPQAGIRELYGLQASECLYQTSHPLVSLAPAREAQTGFRVVSIASPKIRARLPP